MLFYIIMIMNRIDFDKYLFIHLFIYWLILNERSRRATTREKRDDLATRVYVVHTHDNEHVCVRAKENVIEKIRVYLYY